LFKAIFLLRARDESLFGIRQDRACGPIKFAC
jgi:hypothetical protein